MTTPSPIASTENAAKSPATGPSSDVHATPGSSGALPGGGQPAEGDSCSIDPLRATDRYRLTRPLLDTPTQRAEG